MLTPYMSGFRPTGFLTFSGVLKPGEDEYRQQHPLWFDRELPDDALLGGGQSRAEAAIRYKAM